MKVILQREVEKLGAPGDVVDVADGYANNFLVPRGLALRATKGALKQAERLRDLHEKRLRRSLDEANAMAERLRAAPLRIRARAGEDGRLFGSVTVADVAAELERTSGVAVDRRRLHLAGPIRSLGSHEFVVHLHPEVNPTLNLEVVPE